MNDWGWQENGPAGAAVSSAPAGGIQAEILRRQNMRLNPTESAPFQISPQQRADILGMQIGSGPLSNEKSRSMGMMRPNNGRPVGHEFANGVQMNPIMGGAPVQQQANNFSQNMTSPMGTYAPNGENYSTQPMQPFQQLPPQANNFNQDSGGSAAFNRAWSAANNVPYDGKANQDATAQFYRELTANKSQYRMPNTAQPNAQMQGNQQLAALLRQLLGGG